MHPIMSNFEWPYLRNGSLNPLHVCSRAGFSGSVPALPGGSNGAIFGSIESKTADITT